MFADAYVKEFIRGGKRHGYAEGFYNILNKSKNGQDLMNQLDPYSKMNGAAMRAVPIGVLPTIREVLEVAGTQAKVTHNTDVGLFGARAVALMSHFSLYEDEPLKNISEYCLDNLPREDTEKFYHVFKETWSGGKVIGNNDWTLGITTIHAVVHLLGNAKSLKGIMKNLLTWGGDTDSVAAISWGIASTFFQEEELPSFLEKDLENGSKELGSSYLKELGKNLMDKFNKE